MIVTVFRSRLMPDRGAEYAALSARLSELAKTMPGYNSHKGFTAEDDERVTIVEFESEEGMCAWATNLEHRDAKKRARDTYCAAYSVQVCELKRESKFERKAKS